jgi:hypothetical protein
MHKYLGKTDKLLYIYHGKADKIRPFNIRKGDKFHWSIIQVFQFTCCSNLAAFKFQVNKKTQNHISVYFQECGFESFCILLFEQQYRYMNVHLLIHILPIFRYCELFNFVVSLHQKK